MNIRTTLTAALFFAIGTLAAQNNLLRLGTAVQGFSYGNDGQAGLSLGFENRLSRKWTVGFDADFFFDEENYENGAQIREKAWAIQPEVKFYFAEAMRGFYLGGHLAYHAFDYKVDLGDGRFDLPENPGPGQLVSTGFTLGYTNTIVGRLTLSTFIGGDFVFSPGIAGEGAKYRMGMQLGYTF